MMKKMKLIQLQHKEDFGHEYILKLLTIRHWNLLQVSVSWNDYPASPYIQMSLGNHRLFSLLTWAYKFAFEIELCGTNWDYYSTYDKDDQ